MIDKDDVMTVGALICLVAIIIAPFAAWVTHVVWWINLAMNEEMDTLGEFALAVIGTLFFPIGIIHGFILWF